MVVCANPGASDIPNPPQCDPGGQAPKLNFKPLSSIDPIKKVGEEIIAGYQLIEEAWKRAEAKLALAHVPVDVKIKVRSGNIGDEPDADGRYTEFLSYVKIKNQWRICAIVENIYLNCAGSGVETDVRPITECPVQVRLDMFEWFPKLHEEVIKVTKSFVPVIKEKVAVFQNVLETIDLWS